MIKNNMKNFILGLALLIAGVASAQFGLSANAENGFMDDDITRGIVLADYNVTGMSNFMVGPKVGFRADVNEITFLTGATIGVQGEKMGFHIDGLYALDSKLDKADAVVVRPYLAFPIKGSMFDVQLGYSTDISLKNVKANKDAAFVGLKYKF